MNIWNGLPVLILGTGGISREVKCIIDEINKTSKAYDFLGYVSEKKEEIGSFLGNDRVASNDEELEEYIKDFKVIGIIIPIGTPAIKKKIAENLVNKFDNVVFPNIIDPRANIGNIAYVKMGYGNIICAGVTLTTDISFGNFNLININSTIGHDVVIENYCVINPLVSISGNCYIDDLCLIGAGASIKQGIKVSKKSVVGLGAFIVKDVDEGNIMVCSPAQNMNKNR